MGCGASTKSGDAQPAAQAAPPQQAQQQAPAQVVQAEPAPAPAAPPAPPAPAVNAHVADTRKLKFQIKLKGDWTNYKEEEGEALERAYLAGFPFAQYSIRGQDYKYDFEQSLQINLKSGKERNFRPPPGLKRPSKPIVPPGPTMVIKVPPNGKGGVPIKIPHPKLAGMFITVLLPKNAMPGKEILVPVPPDPNTQQSGSAPAEQKKGGWSSGAIAASGAAAAGVAAVGIGGLVVAGAVLGEDTIMDGLGTAGAEAGAALAPAAAQAGAALAPGVAVVGDAAGTVGDALAPGADAVAGAGGDVAASAWDAAGGGFDAAGDGFGAAADAMPGLVDAAGDVATDASDWILNMGGEVGGFMMELF